MIEAKSQNVPVGKKENVLHIIFQEIIKIYK